MADDRMLTTKKRMTDCAIAPATLPRDSGNRKRSTQARCSAGTMPSTLRKPRVGYRPEVIGIENVGAEDINVRNADHEQQGERAG